MHIELDLYQVFSLVILFSLAILWAWSKGYKEGRTVGYFRGRAVAWHANQKDVAK